MTREEALKLKDGDIVTGTLSDNPKEFPIFNIRVGCKILVFDKQPGPSNKPTNNWSIKDITLVKSNTPQFNIFN